MTYQAFVLAAGFGTRLRPLTLHRPKPLVPVCGVPMLAHALALCAKHGLRRVVVNAHYLHEQVSAWAGQHEGCEVHIAVELPEILGTGGGLKQVAQDLDERFVVVNADILTDVDLSALVHGVPEGGAAMALRVHQEESQTYGIVAADDTGIVTRLASVATAVATGHEQTDTHFTGVHAMHRDMLDHIPDGFACVVRTAYRETVPKRKVRGLRHDALWMDVGDPLAYLETNLAVLRGEVTPPLDCRARSQPVPRGVTVSGEVWIGRDVQIAPGTHLKDCIVGDRAVVAGGHKTSCVIWSDVEVPTGRHERTIFHDGGALRL